MTTGGRVEDQAISALSAREREVLALIAKGRTNPQIGEELGLTFATAKWYVSEVISKLGVDSREEAAAEWRRYRSPPTRALRAWQGLVGVSVVKSVGAGAAATVTVVIIAAVAIALTTANGNDDSPAPPAAQPDAGGGLVSLPPPATPIPVVDVESGAEGSLPVANMSSYEWSPDGRYLVASEGEAGIVLADAATGERWQVHDDRGGLAPFSPDSEIFAVGTRERAIVFDLEGQEIGQVASPESGLPPAYWRFSWSPDGENLAIGIPDVAITFWTRDGTTQRIEGPYWDFAWRSENELIAVQGAQGEDAQSSFHRITLAPGGPEESRLATVDEGPTSVAVAPGGGMAGVVHLGGADPVRSFSLIDVDSGNTQATFEAMPGAPHGTGFPFTLRTDSAVLSTNDCREGPSEVMLGFQDGATRTLGDGMAVQAAFSPDGNELAYTYQAQLWVVPVDGSEEPRSIADVVNPAAPIRWSPDGEQIGYITSPGQMCP